MNAATFSARMNKARNEKGLTLKALAAAANVSPSAMTHYGRGASLPPLDIATRLASVLDVSLDWLCGLQEETAVQNTEKTLNTYGDIARSIIGLLNMSGPKATCEANADRFEVSLRIHDSTILYAFFSKYLGYTNDEKFKDATEVVEEWTKARIADLDNIHAGDILANNDKQHQGGSQWHSYPSRNTPTSTARPE